MGNTAKPTALKLVHGTDRKDRAQPNEPKPKVAAPKMPAHLPAKAKTYWKELCELLGSMGVLTVADGRALEQLCSAYCEWRDLLKEIDRSGRTYEVVNAEGSILIKANPAVAMASDAQKRIKSFMVEFGMTPASRTKINAQGAPTVDPLEEYLSRKS